MFFVFSCAILPYPPMTVREVLPSYFVATLIVIIGLMLSCQIFHVYTNSILPIMCEISQIFIVVVKVLTYVL